jgi:hypothetical protein
VEDREMSFEDRTRIVVKNEKRRLVYGEVYAPNQIDTDGEAMSAEEIEKMAHNFLMHGRTDRIDEMHSYKQTGCLVCESFIARKNDPDGFVRGSWVLGVYVLPDEMWEKVQKGEINGFSFAGRAQSDEVVAMVKVVRKMIGETEESEEGLLPPHRHALDIEFDEDGKIVKGETDVKFEHRHPVLRTTATEESLEHSHRMILIDNEE